MLSPKRLVRDPRNAHVTIGRLAPDTRDIVTNFVAHCLEVPLSIHTMSAFGQKRTFKHLTGLVALLRSFEPLPCEQEIVEGLGSRCHTLGLRAKNISVGGQHFDIDCFVDAFDDSRSHH